MKRSHTEKVIKSSHKKDYVKMIKGLVSPKRKDKKNRNKSQEDTSSRKSNPKSAKSKLRKAKEIEAFNRKISN